MLRRATQRQLAALYDEYSEKRPPAERRAWLDGRLAKQIQFAYRHAPAVKRKLDDAGVAPNRIRTIEDLELLPITTKDELVKVQASDPPFGGYLAVPVNTLNRVYISPGPIYDAWGDERVAAMVKGFMRAGMPRPGDVVMVSNAYHMVPAGLALTDALDVMGCTVVPAGVGQTDLQVKIMHDLKVSAIFAFPSFTMSMLKRAEEMGYNVKKDFKLRYVSGGGERHIQVLRKVFEDQYGVMVGDGYGTADLGGVAYDCGVGNGYHYDDDVCIIEIVDPATGKQVKPLEEGEVVVTLLSRVYPLTRFGTGDLASYTDETCRCGRTSHRITKILGMVGDHVRVKGMFVHGRELDEAFSKIPEVSRFQMLLRLVDQRDRIVMNVETDGGADRKALSETINKRCQDIFKLRMDEIVFLARGALHADSRKVVDSRW